MSEKKEKDLSVVGLPETNVNGVEIKLTRYTIITFDSESENTVNREFTSIKSNLRMKDFKLMYGDTVEVLKVIPSKETLVIPDKLINQLLEEKQENKEEDQSKVGE